MKAAATFCVLAVVCFFGNADAANEGTNAIKRLESETKTAISQLERYGRTLVSDANRKLSDQKISALTTLNTITNPTMNSIRSAIDAAKANGKDAEHCYEPARIEMRQASYIDANVELDQCKNDGVATVAPVKSNIDSAVLNGNNIINDLHRILLSCASAGPLNVQNCIMGQVPSARMSVTNFKNTADQLKSTGNSVLSSAVSAASACNQRPVEKVRQVASNVRASSTNCIANS